MHIYIYMLIHYTEYILEEEDNTYFKIEGMILIVHLDGLYTLCMDTHS